LIKLLKKSEPGSAGEKKLIAWCLFLAGFLLILDQATKIIAENRLTLGERIPIIPDFFNLTLITNKGAAWGILHGYAWLLLIIGAVVIGASIFFMRWLTEGWQERYFALFIVLSGVIGNSIDRIWRGEVIDFLDFYIKSWHWPAFNVADSAICVGVTIFFLSVFFRPLKTIQKQNKTKDIIENIS